MRSRIRWQRRLRRLRVTKVHFAGGTIKCRYARQSGDGIQYLAHDYVAIVGEGRLYLVPYAALRRVQGKRQLRRHRFIKKKLHSHIRQWVDPEGANSPDQFLWHSLINRSGREFRGIILRVSRRRGIRIRLQSGARVWVRWSRLGAATEILE